MTNRISVDQYKSMSAKSNYRALGRMKAGQMNNTEKRFSEYLEGQKRLGAVIDYWFDCVNLRLGDNCHYRPDFMVMMNTGEIELIEVKGGYVTDDSLVKLKVAADKFPFRFRMFKWVNKKWEQIEY